jgi:hypothetical protein
MEAKTVKMKSGNSLFFPVFNEEFENLVHESSTGFCLACGESADGIEPDGERLDCENCGAPKVYGLEQLLLLGFIR